MRRKTITFSINKAMSGTTNIWGETNNAARQLFDQQGKLIAIQDMPIVNPEINYTKDTIELKTKDGVFTAGGASSSPPLRGLCDENFSHKIK